MKKIFLASASAGSRPQLATIAWDLAKKHVLYIPMLGFMGIDETAPAFRSEAIEIDQRILKDWAEVLVIVYEGVKSVGIWDEARAMFNLHRPVALYCIGGTVPSANYDSKFHCFVHFVDLDKWLDEL